MICFEESGTLSPEPIFIEYTSDDQLVTTCSKGHTAPLAVQQLDFEILFDLAGMALLDGYTREAVTGFAASLERAYDFYVRCVLTEAKFSGELHDLLATSFRTTPEQMMSSVMKEMSRQSERQLGAFLAVYALTERLPPPTLSAKWVEFRNLCTHKGTIPTAAKACEYAQAVMTAIDALVGTLKRAHSGAVQRQIVGHLARFKTKSRVTTTNSIPTIVSLLHDHGGTSFKERLRGLQKYRIHAWALQPII